MRTCTTREHWLAMSRKNYVMFIFGLTYDREITQSDRADDVCANDKSEGLVFLTDRICSCPPKMYYHINYGNDDEYYEKCTPLPDKLDQDHLLFDLHYTYRGRQFVQHVIMLTFDQCTYGGTQ